MSKSVNQLFWNGVSFFRNQKPSNSVPHGPSWTAGCRRIWRTLNNSLARKERRKRRSVAKRVPGCPGAISRELVGIWWRYKGKFGYTGGHVKQQKEFGCVWKWFLPNLRVCHHLLYKNSYWGILLVSNGIYTFRQVYIVVCKVNVGLSDFPGNGYHDVKASNCLP